MKDIRNHQCWNCVRTVVRLAKNEVNTSVSYMSGVLSENNFKRPKYLGGYGNISNEIER